MKHLKKHILTLLGSTLLMSCSMVSLDSQAKGVAVANDIQSTKGCQSLGETNVSLWSKASTFQTDAKVIDQLDTLARNQAAQMGGNKVIPVSPINEGKRTYRVYKCSANPTSN